MAVAAGCVTPAADASSAQIEPTSSNTAAGRDPQACRSCIVGDDIGFPPRARARADVTATDTSVRDLALAFAETPGRFICEVPTGARERFEASMAGVPWAWAGVVLPEPTLEIVGTTGHTSRLPVADLSRAWRRISSTHS